MLLTAKHLISAEKEDPGGQEGLQIQLEVTLLNLCNLMCNNKCSHKITGGEADWSSHTSGTLSVGVSPS